MQQNINKLLKPSHNYSKVKTNAIYSNKIKINLNIRIFWRIFGAQKFGG